MKIIQHATRKFETELSREFRWKDDSGAGFGFDCDRDGNAITLKSDAARENWEGCISGRFAVVDLGIEKRENSWLEPAVGRCDCGQKVVLRDPLDNHCACGRCFNSSGQSVTPSNECDQWGNPLDDLDPRNWQEEQ